MKNKAPNVPALRTEVRILFARVWNRGITQKSVARELGINPGSLSHAMTGIRGDGPLYLEILTRVKQNLQTKLS
jgi:predicted transcriptional regulator